MSFTPQQFEEKQYNLCLNCARIGKDCDGPNFLAMDIPRLCEWCRLRKDYLHSLDPKWTNQYIADQAGLAKVSVDRFLSGKATDLKATTISQVINVLVNGSWGQYSCTMIGLGEKSEEDFAILEAECERLKEIIISKDEEINDRIKRLDFLREQIRTKDRLLDERADFLRIKDKYIRILGTLFAISLILFICLLAIDIINPDIGYI